MVNNLAMPLYNNKRETEEQLYVTIVLKQPFQMMDMDEDGNPVPISPESLPAGAYMFRGMIDEAYFPTTTTVGDNCFRGCTTLKKAYFPVVETLGVDAFNGCTSLVGLDESHSLRNIGDGCFQGCVLLGVMDLQ